MAEQLTRKGVGGLDLVDFDVVMPSNLQRAYYFARDCRKLKPIALARNLAKVAVHATLLRAFPVRAEEYLLRKPEFDLAVCLVDVEGAREAVSQEVVALGRPCIFGAASADGNSCRVVVQEPGKACYGCSGGFGGAEGCGPMPSINDIQGVLASVIVYAVDTLLMQRPRHWNLRQIFLSGGDFSRDVPRDPRCLICAYKV